MYIIYVYIHIYVGIYMYIYRQSLDRLLHAQKAREPKSIPLSLFALTTRAAHRPYYLRPHSVFSLLALLVQRYKY